MRYPSVLVSPAAAVRTSAGTPPLFCSFVLKFSFWWDSHYRMIPPYKHCQRTADMSATSGWLGNRSNKQTCPIGWLIVTNEHHWDMTFRGGP